GVENAAGIVERGGRLVLLAGGRPNLGPGVEVVRSLDEPQLAIKALAKADVPGSGPARQWARAAAMAKLSVWSGWEDDVAEELFATPLHNADEVRRLIGAAECVLLEDGERMIAVASPVA